MPPSGSFIIGMSNRVVYNDTIDVLVAGVFLCSGEENWTTVKDSKYNTTNGTGELALCKAGEILCSIELKMAEFGKQ
jgi:hypothetical protein